MADSLIDPSWKRLYELVCDLSIQKSAFSMLSTIFEELDSLVPADRGVVLAELKGELPIIHRWPEYTEPLASLFNTHYNATVPIRYDRKNRVLGPVQWRRFSDSEYDCDFNRPLDIGHSFGLGISDRLENREYVLVLHRSRHSRGFTESDLMLLDNLRRPLENLFNLRLQVEKLSSARLFEREYSAGCTKLSRREAQVAQLLLTRLTCRNIAGLLNISPRTVERHALHIYQKLDVSGRDELAAVLGSRRKAVHSAY